MKRQISTAQTITSGGAWSMLGSTVANDTWPHLVSDFLTGQIKAVFTNAASVLTFTPTAPLSMLDDSGAALRNFAFWIKGDKQNEDTAASYEAKIRFTDSGPSPGTVEYYLPTPKAWQQLRFQNPGLDQIDLVEILCLDAEGVEIILQNVLAYTDQLPRDLYAGLVAHIDRYAAPAKIQIGTLTAAPGDNRVVIANMDFVTMYSLISIGPEKHQIKEYDESDGSISFWPERFDGDAILGTWTNEPVYLEFPVIEEATEEEVIIPCLAMAESWGWTNDPMQDPSSDEVDSWNVLTDTVRIFQRGDARIYKPVIEAYSHHKQISEILDRILRLAFNEVALFYVNGHLYEIDSDALEQIPPPEDGTAGLVFSVSPSIRVTEEIWQDQQVTQTTAPLNVTRTVTSDLQPP